MLSESIQFLAPMIKSLRVELSSHSGYCRRGRELPLVPLGLLALAGAAIKEGTLDTAALDLRRTSDDKPRGLKVEFLKVLNKV